MFLDYTQRRTTVGRTPLDEWSARRRDLYLTTHDTHNRQISMPRVGLEPKTVVRRCVWSRNIKNRCSIYIYIYIYIYDISSLRVKFTSTITDYLLKLYSFIFLFPCKQPDSVLLNAETRRGNWVLFDGSKFCFIFSTKTESIQSTEPQITF